MISSVPIPSRTASKAIMPGTEKRECAPCTAGSEIPSRTSPTAVIPSPAHWRQPMVRPNARSAMIASSTIPPASTTCTTESGDHRHRGDVEDPRADRRRACRSRTGCEENSLPSRPDGTAEVDRRRRAGTAVLVEKAEIRRERAAKREGDAQEQGHNGLREEVVGSGRSRRLPGFRQIRCRPKGVLDGFPQIRRIYVRPAWRVGLSGG